MSMCHHAIDRLSGKDGKEDVEKKVCPPFCPTLLLTVAVAVARSAFFFSFFFIRLGTLPRHITAPRGSAR